MNVLPFNCLDSLEHFGKNYFTFERNVYAKKKGGWEEESLLKMALRIASWATLILPLIALLSYGTSCFIRHFYSDSALQIRLKYWELVVQPDIRHDRIGYGLSLKNALVHALAHSDIHSSAYPHIYMTVSVDGISDIPFGFDGAHREPLPLQNDKPDLILFVPGPNQKRADERLRTCKNWTDLVFGANNISRKMFHSLAISTSSFTIFSFSSRPQLLHSIGAPLKKQLCS